MKIIVSIITVLLCTSPFLAQNILHTSHSSFTIKVDDEIITTNWLLDTSLVPDIFHAEIEKQAVVLFSDGEDSISYTVAQGDTIDFAIILNKVDTAYTQIIGVEPNATFSNEYIAKHQNKTFVEIPEISELVNIIMVLHKDAEKETNMFDTSTDYYKRVKKHFEPFRNHPIIDTIQHYISGLRYVEDNEAEMFSNEAYMYYYGLKMNACAYEFDADNHIVNMGTVKEFAKGWTPVDPMGSKDLIEDFAKESNFRAFYKSNKSYYDSLIVTYNQLNPIQKMQDWLDDKFKFGYGSYVIYFSPIISGAHSTQKFTEDNFSQTFMFICKAEYMDKYNAVQNELIQSRVVFTEIDHNYVNPISNNYIERINESFESREKWSPSEITNNYHNPYMVFNEYMTFAVYSLYIFDNYTDQQLEEFLPIMENQMTKGRGFIKFKEFNRELLHVYKDNPSITIDELYDHILSWSKNQ